MWYDQCDMHVIFALILLYCLYPQDTFLPYLTFMMNGWFSLASDFVQYQRKIKLLLIN